MSIMSSSLDAKLWIKKRTLASFVVLGMRSAGNAPQKWKTKFLLHDNATAHRTALVMDFSLCTLKFSPPKLLHKILQYTPKSHILSSQSLSLQQECGPTRIKELRFTEMSRATTSLKGIIWAITPTCTCKDLGKSLKSSHYFHRRFFIL
jgi:hypothetical protein